MDGAAELGNAAVSKREAQVLDLLGEHLTHAQIGARLFISVRTVESHVASLRRKLEIGDHRSLVRFAVSRRAGTSEQETTPIAGALPSPLTSFVGRVAERAALAAALAQSRLVTAVGPGGVGKTRLAIAVAADVSDSFPDGTWYVDLVPVTDPTTLVAAVMRALGLSEQARQSPEDALVAGLRDRQGLLVLDNCEHLIDRVAVLSERMLSAAPRLVLLATSRTRMVVPHERVYQVPGMSLPDATERGDGDAVVLLLERAAAAGYPAAAAGEHRRAASVCRALDGSALAIELAAARLPALGWDALEEALADPLSLLTGGPRLESRHRSLQDTLDWSYRLLDPVDQAVCRRVSVFAAAFSPSAARVVTAFAPVDPTDVIGALARLVDHSLLVAVPAADGPRYRVLETIRQYGLTRIDVAGEQEVFACHLGWALGSAAEIERDAAGDQDGWRVAFDAAADDLRSALGWSSGQPQHRKDAYRLATVLARLLFLRGRPSESQRRYEQAAGLTDDPASAALAFQCAAAVAKCRIVGPDALRLDRAAAGAALQAGDRAGASVAFARCAELLVRYRGMFAEPAEPGAVDALLADARRHAHDDQRAEAAILAAAANTGDPRDPMAEELAERAVELSQRAGDPLLESAALDALMMAQITRGGIVDAAGTTRRRVALLADLTPEPGAAFEQKDALHCAVFASIGAGDLPGAHRWAQQQSQLPFLREEAHLAGDELLAPAALTGDWDLALGLSEQFLTSWDQAGRPAAPGRGMSPSAVAMVHGLRGDDAARAEWLAILATIRGVDRHLASHGSGYGPVFDALVALHRGRTHEALLLLTADPGDAPTWWYQVFCHWYGALRAEAAVLAERPDAAELIAQATVETARNPLAAALVQRARALMVGDRTALLAAADLFDAAGCRYQRARTLVLTGGQAGDAGRAALAAMGAAAMVD